MRVRGTHGAIWPSRASTDIARKKPEAEPAEPFPDNRPSVVDDAHFLSARAVRQLSIKRWTQADDPSLEGVPRIERVRRKGPGFVKQRAVAERIEISACG